MRSLRLRLLVGAGILIALALAVAGLLISTLLRDFVVRTFDARLGTTMVAIMGAVEYDADGEAFAVARMAGEPEFDRPLSGWYWQIDDGETVLLKSRSLWTESLRDPARSEAEIPGPSSTPSRDALFGPRGLPVRTIERNFTVPGGGPPLRVIVAGPASLINEELAIILPPLALSLLALWIGLVAAVFLQVHIGLGPLDRLRQSLGRVRSGALGKLPDERMSELQPLAEEINALITHNAAVLERARLHVGNLAHSLQTPLAFVSNVAGEPGRDPDGGLKETVGRMQRLVRYHLRRARTAGAHGLLVSNTPVRRTLSDLFPVLRGVYADKSIDFDIDVPRQLVFAGERHDLEEMLGNLVDNACKWSRQTVRVSGARHGGRLILHISDDGPGLDDKVIAEARRRGVRMDESKPGAGLGLAIVQDLVALYAGEIAFQRGALGGLEVTLTLPAA